MLNNTNSVQHFNKKAMILMYYNDNTTTPPDNEVIKILNSDTNKKKINMITR